MIRELNNVVPKHDGLGMNHQPLIPVYFQHTAFLSIPLALVTALLSIANSKGNGNLFIRNHNKLTRASSFAFFTLGSCLDYLFVKPQTTLIQPILQSLWRPFNKIALIISLPSFRSSLVYLFCQRKDLVCDYRLYKAPLRRPDPGLSLTPSPYGLLAHQHSLSTSNCSITRGLANFRPVSLAGLHPSTSVPLVTLPVLAWECFLNKIYWD